MQVGRGDPGEDLVHGSGAVALGVEGDVQEAEGFEGLRDLVEGFEVEDPVEVFAGYFDAGEVAVVADADLREAEAVECLFGLLDLGEVFAGNWASVLDAGGEAGTGGFIGEGEAGFAGEGANFRLGELRSDQRCDGVVLGSSLLSRAEGSDSRGLVVEVHAVGEVGEVAGGAGLLHVGEELVLAVEAALAVVADVVGAVQLSGLEDLGGDVVLGGEGEGGGEFGSGQGGRVSDDGEHLIAEGLVGGIGEVGGVGAAGVGDEHGAEVAKGLVEQRAFFCQGHLKVNGSSGVGCV